MCVYGPGGQTEANTEMGLDPKLCLRERPSLLQRSDSTASCPRNVSQRTSQVVQWLGLCTSTAGSLGLILGWGRYRKSSSQKKKKKKKCELDPQVVIQSLSLVQLFKTTWTAASKLGLISTAEGKAPHLWEEKASPPSIKLSLCFCPPPSLHGSGW